MAALTPAQIVSVFVGLEVCKFIFNSSFFPLLFSPSCKSVVDFLHRCELTIKQRPRSYEQLSKASRIPYLTLWWDFIALMRYRFYSSQEVFSWKRLYSWFVGSFHNLWWFMCSSEFFSERGWNFYFLLSSLAMKMCSFPTWPPWTCTLFCWTPALLFKVVWI